LGGGNLRLALGLEALPRAGVWAATIQSPTQLALALLLQSAGAVHPPGAFIRQQDVPQVAPVLLPHVAHQVRRQQAFADLAALHAVGLLQAVAGVAVQLLVEWPDLVPQTVGLGGEGLRLHVVAAAPHRTGVGVAHLRGALVHQLDEAGVVLAEDRKSTRLNSSHVTMSYAVF